MYSIIRICRLVGGLPLAIELAASWVRMLSAREIAQELEKGFDFLESRKLDVPQRHRSIKTVFDHSWKLLTDNERELLMKLSVFQGGFTREAAFNALEQHSSCSRPLWTNPSCATVKTQTVTTCMNWCAHMPPPSCKITPWKRQMFCSSMPFIILIGSLPWNGNLKALVRCKQRRSSVPRPVTGIVRGTGR